MEFKIGQVYKHRNVPGLWLYLGPADWDHFIKFQNLECVDQFYTTIKQGVVLYFEPANLTPVEKALYGI